MIWQAEFEQKQVDMREQVVKFEKFIQENDAKRIRAEAKAKQVASVTETIQSACPFFGALMVPTQEAQYVVIDKSYHRLKIVKSLERDSYPQLFVGYFTPNNLHPISQSATAVLLDLRLVRILYCGTQERRILDQQAAELRKLEKELSLAMAEVSKRTSIM